LASWLVAEAAAEAAEAEEAPVAGCFAPEEAAVKSAWMFSRKPFRLLAGLLD
jgi:hypothetical protein